MGSIDGLTAFLGLSGVISCICIGWIVSFRFLKTDFWMFSMVGLFFPFMDRPCSVDSLLDGC